MVRNKKIRKNIAKNMVKDLFEFASKYFKSHKKYANKAVVEAKKVAAREAKKVARGRGRKNKR